MKKKLIALYEKLYALFWERKIKIAPRMRLKNIIVFESVPDMADNTKAVFDEMLKRKLNRKYKLVWILYDQPPREYESIHNVAYYASYRLEAKYYSMIAKAKICCNRFLTKERKNQISIYLSHGTAVKSTRDYYTIPNGIDYVIASSKNVAAMQGYELNFDVDNIVPLGFPRNDAIGRPPVDIRKILNTDCEKIIVWYPTYRQHKNGFRTGCKNALPIIHDSECAEDLNLAARKNKILIVLKPHFVQDINNVKDLGLSNLRIIDDSFFVEHNIRSYEFLNASDALITDYSSIYYDYALCGKPIAAIWEDVEEYKAYPGLVDNYEYLLKGMEKIYTLDEFVSFIERVSKGIDLLKSEREEIRDYANISTDGQNSARVVDFIIERVNAIMG